MVRVLLSVYLVSTGSVGRQIITHGDSKVPTIRRNNTMFDGSVVLT